MSDCPFCPACDSIPPYIWSGNLISPELIDAIYIASKQTIAWKAGRVASASSKSYVIDTTVRKAEVSSLALMSSSLAMRYVDQITRVIGRHIAAVWPLPRYTLSPPTVIRYARGGYYIAHSDNTGRTDTRLLTVITYLNTPLAGGETRFPAYNLSIRSLKGMSLIFLSDYEHESMPVLAGEKAICQCWIIPAKNQDWL
jgi:prolyl 4-hydroxylase